MDGSSHLDLALAAQTDTNPARGIIIGVALSTLLWAVIVGVIILALFG